MSFHDHVQVFPRILRGLVDEELAEINKSRSHRNVVLDPMPKFIRVLERFVWVWISLRRPKMTFQDVDELESAIIELLRLITTVFPDKNGPRGRQGAWSIPKFHELMHFTDSIRLYGKDEVTLCLLTVTFCAPIVLCFPTHHDLIFIMACVVCRT